MHEWMDYALALEDHKAQLTSALEDIRFQKKEVDLQLETTLKSNELQRIQLEKMSKIVIQLNKRGLPLPNDEAYFSEEFEKLTSGVQRWARAYKSKKPLPPLVQEDIDNLEPRIKKHLTLLFPSLPTYLGRNENSDQIRRRCVEIILSGELQGYVVGWPMIGLDVGDPIHTHIEKVCSTFECSGMWIMSIRQLRETIKY